MLILSRFQIKGKGGTGGGFEETFMKLFQFKGGRLFEKAF